MRNLLYLFCVAFVLQIGCVGNEAIKPSLEKKATQKAIEFQRVNRHIVRATPARRLLYVTFKLRPDTLYADMDIAHSLNDLHWFTEVLFMVPSLQALPDAFEHPVVREAIAVCKRRGIRYGYGRRLWHAFPPKGDVSTFMAEYFPSHYIEAISTIQNEAWKIGASFTAIDAEPYGTGPQSKSMKFHHFDDADRREVANAIRTATQQVGFVDLVYPASSSDSPWHFAWMMQLLAVQRLDSKTYWTKAPDYWTPRVIVPDGYTWRVDLIGSIVGVVLKRKTGDVILTPKDVKQINMRSVRDKFPNSSGQWVFIPHQILAKTIRSW